jgi:purine nucleoside permease
MWRGYMMNLMTLLRISLPVIKRTSISISRSRHQDTTILNLLNSEQRGRLLAVSNQLEEDLSVADDLLIHTAHWSFDTPTT